MAPPGDGIFYILLFIIPCSRPACSDCGIFTDAGHIARDEPQGYKSILLPSAADCGYGCWARAAQRDFTNTVFHDCPLTWHDLWDTHRRRSNHRRSLLDADARQSPTIWHRQGQHGVWQLRQLLLPIDLWNSAARLLCDTQMEARRYSCVGLDYSHASLDLRSESVRILLCGECRDHERLLWYENTWVCRFR